MCPAGIYKTIGPEWIKKIRKSVFKEENLTDSLRLDGKNTFEHLEEIVSIAIVKKEIKSDWATILNQIVLIPSVYFKKLVIETNKLTQSEL